MESEQFRWIGKSLPRVEDERLMRGTGRYIDDLEPFPGCKVAAIEGDRFPLLLLHGYPMSNTPARQTR